MSNYEALFQKVACDRCPIFAKPLLKIHFAMLNRKTEHFASQRKWSKSDQIPEKCTRNDQKWSKKWPNLRSNFAHLTSFGPKNLVNLVWSKTPEIAPCFYDQTAKNGSRNGVQWSVIFWGVWNLFMKRPLLPHFCARPGLPSFWLARSLCLWPSLKPTFYIYIEKTTNGKGKMKIFSRAQIFPNFLRMGC